MTRYQIDASITHAVGGQPPRMMYDLKGKILP